MLRQKGINTATPETMAEPPLETSVYDSVDKPDADAAGNDPLTEQEMLLSMERDEDQHQLKVSKSLAELSRAEAEAARAENEHGDKSRRDEEVHQERIRQMRQPKAKSGG